MAAIANLSGNTNGSTRNGNGTITNINNGGCTTVPQKSAMVPSGTERSLKDKFDVSADWTSDAESLLKEVLEIYALELASNSNAKSIRDVALECGWTTENKNGKRKKDDSYSSKERKHKKEKSADQQAKPTSHDINDTNGPVSKNHDDGISSEAFGGVSWQLIKENDRALDQVSANFSAKISVSKVHENLNLLRQTRNNTLIILNELKKMPEATRQMPPLPVMLDEELANLIFPLPIMSMQL